ncbi:TPA: site-specific integrase [Vibrio parahaemolyticus]|nr:site-specific integrase [Vibrio parahaemolyticus]HCH5494718.1 site-specific integrase [Vibrio parahaemolyticus]HCH6275975.1 site-specific integrase [Vibrio parahaemolyticus]HCH6312400.1 site-specific integrase [Vibrio parahaemolyticus]HCH6482986.1 site-specific integrase [Vibrio parahaemolyticus]
METIAFKKDELLYWYNGNSPFGSEIRALEDKRWRAWKRKKGVALGFELHNRGKVKRIVVGVLGDISLTQFKSRVREYIAQVQLYGFEQKTPTLTDYFNGPFMAYSRRNHKSSKSTVSNWNRLSDEIKAKPLNKIKRSDVEAELDRLMQRGLSAASQNRVRALLSKILNLAITDEHISVNVVKFIPALREKSRPIEPLTATAVKRYVQLAKEAENIVHGLALIVMAVSGARATEVRSIRLEDVSEDNHSWLVRDGKNGDDRIVRVGDIGANAIKEARQYSTNEFLFSSTLSSSGFIGFPRIAHNKIVTQLLKEKLMSKPFLMKDLRSQCGSVVYEQTGDIKAAQEQLGHRDISTTVKHYVRTSEQQQMTIAKSIDEFLE